MKTKQSTLFNKYELEQLNLARKTIIDAFTERDAPYNFYSNMMCLETICAARRKYLYFINDRPAKTGCFFTKPSSSYKQAISEIDKHYYETFDLPEIRISLAKEPRIIGFTFSEKKFNGYIYIESCNIIFSDETSLAFKPELLYRKAPNKIEYLKSKKSEFKRKLEELAMQEDNLSELIDSPNV